MKTCRRRRRHLHGTRRSGRSMAPAYLGLGGVEVGHPAPILERLVDARGTRRFWQRGGGYDRNIHSDTEFDEKIGYIHMNPVRAGLVKTPADWAWSSARWWDGEREGQIECDSRTVRE